MQWFTATQIRDYMESGAEYVRDWISWGNDPKDFDGQSEAFDMAMSIHPHHRIAESIGDYIYTGMRNEIDHQLKIRRG